MAKKKTSPGKESTGKTEAIMLASSNPKIRAMAGHAKAAVKIIDYLFAIMDRASAVKAPPGVSLGPVVAKVTGKDAYGDAKCAKWMLKVTSEVILGKGARGCPCLRDSSMKP